MYSRPTYEEIAEIAGLSVDEVGTYFVSCLQRPDGSWLIFFSREALKGLKGKLEKLSENLTLTIPAKQARQ
ncbi:hypothetical protein [Pseudomonas fluorescens]|uniref:Uncharacterized protein n=1 Tax=Pseudomonas fluorescens TaxID=294 RepID=A0A5E7Q0G0_PSEFL|nr:hypothetical protein [Pseudomonas fluorescens]VVP55068.1 hypothetical protein PS880_05627 [Pseudomonas fluorescens]